MYSNIVVLQILTRDHRYLILPAITLNDGIIECMIVKGLFNGDLFASFISDLVLKMQPFLAPKSVIIMDNCAIHKVPRIREIIKSKYVQSFSFLISTESSHRGLWLEYLPAYSPDLNPIELAFSLLKSKLHRAPPPNSSNFEVREYLYLQAFGISVADCRAFYHQSGYF